MADKSGLRDISLSASARRLHQIAEAGIVDPGWIAGQIETETLEALKQQASRQKRPGLNTRISEFFASVLGHRRSLDRQAKQYADAIETLMRDPAVKTADEFELRLNAISTTDGHIRGLENAMRSARLHALDLPLDALQEASFRTMLTAAFYRFAYGRDRAVDFFSRARARSAEGVYTTFLSDRGSSMLEKRILAYKVVNTGFAGETFIRVVELSRQNGALIVRSGVVVPNQSHEAFILSGDVELEECRTWLQGWAGAHDDPLFDPQACVAPHPKMITQSHRLGFLTVRTRNPDEIVGAFLDGELHGQLIGSRLAAEKLTSQLIASVGRFRQDQVESLSADERNLVGSMPRYAIDAQAFKSVGQASSMNAPELSISQPSAPSPSPVSALGQTDPSMQLR